MKRILGILLLLATFTAAIPTLSAQDTAITCDLDYLNKVVDTFTLELGKLKDSKETDTVKIASKLQDLAESAAIVRAACDNLAFKGTAQKLIGPVILPKGTYRATMKTGGYGIVTVTPADGECGQGKYMDSNVFLIVDGQAKDGVETLFISQGCTAMIEVSNVQGDWSLQFANLTPS